jgi:hypothetical protein
MTTETSSAAAGTTLVVDGAATAVASLISSPIAPRFVDAVVKARVQRTQKKTTNGSDLSWFHD